jgi:hypothetical protein
MTKAIKTFLFFTALAGALFLAAQSLSAMDVSVSKGIQIDPGMVKSALLLQSQQFENLDAEIIIYGYSAAGEVYSLADDGSLSMTIKPGEITAMVKFKDKALAKKIIFLKGSGADIPSQIRSLAENALLELGSYLH